MDALQFLKQSNGSLDMSTQQKPSATTMKMDDVVDLPTFPFTDLEREDLIPIVLHVSSVQQTN